jgi:hypothetical protein
VLVPDVRAWSAVMLAALLVVGTGCEDEQPEPAPPTASSTPLDEVATDTIAVAREEFCARVAPAAVEDVLGAAPADADAWANGERAELAPGLTDVAHEYGCRWDADGTTARAWVFAPPVTPREATALRRAAVEARGCEPVRDAPHFGSPGVAVRCSGGSGEATAFHGLFGDAWLSCSVETTRAGSGPPDETLDRAARWCATVLQAAAG